MFAKVLLWTLAVPLVGTLAVMRPWCKTDAPCVKMAEALRDHSLATGGELVRSSDPVQLGGPIVVTWEVRIAADWEEYRRSLEASMPAGYELVSNREEYVLYRKSIPQDANVYFRAERTSTDPLLVSFEHRAVPW